MFPPQAALSARTFPPLWLVVTSSRLLPALLSKGIRELLISEPTGSAAAVQGDPHHGWISFLSIHSSVSQTQQFPLSDCCGVTSPVLVWL